MPDPEEVLTNWTLEGPDGDGFVWLYTQDRGINLGPRDKVAEKLCEWLGSIDYLERD